MQPKRKNDTRWIGWLIFFFVMFGSRFLPPLTNWLVQVTGLAVSPALLIAAVIGLGVIANVVYSVVQANTKGRTSTQMRLPEPSLPFPRPSALPTSMTSNPSAVPHMRLPPAETPLPNPPRFEPIINLRVLTFGLVGLVVCGGCFLLALLLAGVI